MQVKTTGIILHQVKYTDSSSIVIIYTREFGRISYMVRGANKKRSTCRAALLQPLSVVEIEADHNAKKALQSIREMRIAVPFYDIPFNPVKNALALFMAEVLHKTLRHTENDESLYDFIEESVCELDKCKMGLGNFHLIFMVQLSHHLGFAPSTENAEQAICFDLLNGTFEKQFPQHVHFLLPELTDFFRMLLTLDFDCSDSLRLNHRQRSELLNSLVEYYRLHLTDFHSITSISVLHKLWE